jgi:hypothetical protein
MMIDANFHKELATINARLVEMREEYTTACRAAIMAAEISIGGPDDISDYAALQEKYIFPDDVIKHHNIFQAAMKNPNMYTLRAYINSLPYELEGPEYQALSKLESIIIYA